MFPLDSIYILMFTSGLLGGFGHCVGMCGPVVAAYSINLRERKYLPHLMYNLGRVATYSIIGGIMGLIGSFVGVAQSIERFQNITMVFIGALMVIMGLSVGGWLPFNKRIEQANRLSNLVITARKSLSGSGGIGVFFPMGLVLGFIPCGLVYTAFIAAAGAGASSVSHIEGILKGILMLFLFGIATTPSLLVLGRIVSIANTRWRNRFYRVSAVLMVIAGIIFIYRAL